MRDNIFCQTFSIKLHFIQEIQTVAIQFYFFPIFLAKRNFKSKHFVLWRILNVHRKISGLSLSGEILSLERDRKIQFILTDSISKIFLPQFQPHTEYRNSSLVVTSGKLKRKIKKQKRRFCYAAYNSPKFNGFLNCTVLSNSLLL
jgi:hypothetical protein